MDDERPIASGSRLAGVHQVGQTRSLNGVLETLYHRGGRVDLLREVRGAATPLLHRVAAERWWREIVDQYNLRARDGAIE